MASIITRAYMGGKLPQEAQGHWRSAWSLARQEQVRFNLATRQVAM